MMIRNKARRHGGTKARSGERGKKASSADSFLYASLPGPHFVASSLRAFVPLVFALLVWCPRASASDNKLHFFFIDTEGGASTLIVTPAGESVLIDTGNPGERDPGRII